MPRATRWLPRASVAGEGNTGKKRKKVVQEVVEKEGGALEAHSGIKGERVEVAPTQQDGVATVEVVVEKEGNAPVAPALVAAVLTQEMELVAGAATKVAEVETDIDQVLRELEEIPVLMVRNTEEEWNKDMFMLAGLTQLEREAVLGHCTADIEALLEMEQLQQR
jgi:hypothetical protein